MVRAILVVVLLSVFRLIEANDILILIDPEGAGPHVDIHTYIHPNWILWPEADRSGANRIETVASGVAWRGDFRDLRFVGEGDRYRSLNHGSLQDRGYFDIRDRYLDGAKLVLVEGSGGAIDVNMLLLALDRTSTAVKPAAWKAQWPESAILVAKGRNWDEVAALVRSASGRAIVAEYPPGGRWSRFWLFGRGWPAKVPDQPSVKVPGLIMSSALLSLLRYPNTFGWANSVAPWGGANRWLEFHGEVGKWILFLAGAIVGVALVLGTLFVLQERESGWLAHAIGGCITIPPCLLAAGNLSHLFGLQTFGLWLASACILLPGTGFLLARRLRGAHPITIHCLTGIAISLIFDPTWSVLNPTWSANVNPIPMLMVGSLAAFTAIVAASSKSRWSLIGFGALAAFGLGFRLWWSAPLCLLALASSVVVSQRWFRSWMLVLVLFVSVPVLSARGWTWLPDQLAVHATDIGKVNLALLAQILFSPAVIGLAILGFLASLFGGRFLWRQMGLLLRQDPGRWTPLRSSVALVALSLAWPELSVAAVVVLTSAALMLLYEGVSTL